MGSSGTKIIGVITPMIATADTRYKPIIMCKLEGGEEGVGDCCGGWKGKRGPEE
jgi:hypothetical protein